MTETGPTRVQITLCGFGRVGRCFARLIADRGERLRAAHGVDPAVVGIAELGASVAAPEGLDLERVLAHFESQGSFVTYPGALPGCTGVELLGRAGAGVLVECTPTDVATGEPAASHVRAALEHGMHVVSANKGPFIRGYAELRDLARARGARLKLSAAAAAALPTLDVAEICLAGTEICRIEGVLNGTTNFILSQMHEHGTAYAEALTEAQQLGIAETDPTLDVEGFDTANKLALIANVCMGAALAPESVARTGITGVRAEDVAAARGAGEVLRLVGLAERQANGTVSASVAPRPLPREHPLASVAGAEKGITYTTDTMDRITVSGGKSDPKGAAAAMLKDLINIYR